VSVTGPEKRTARNKCSPTPHTPSAWVVDTFSTDVAFVCTRTQPCAWAYSAGSPVYAFALSATVVKRAKRSADGAASERAKKVEPGRSSRNAGRSREASLNEPLTRSVVTLAITEALCRHSAVPPPASGPLAVWRYDAKKTAAWRVNEGHSSGSRSRAARGSLPPASPRVALRGLARLRAAASMRQPGATQPHRSAPWAARRHWSASPSATRYSKMTSSVPFPERYVAVVRPPLASPTDSSNAGDPNTSTRSVNRRMRCNASPTPASVWSSSSMALREPYTPEVRVSWSRAVGSSPARSASQLGGLYTP
jgi:hypothetical protein